MIKHIAVLAVAAVAVIAVAVSSLVPSASAESFKLKGEANPVWIYYSETNDGGWTQAFDEARQRMRPSSDQDALCGKSSRGHIRGQGRSRPSDSPRP